MVRVYRGLSQEPLPKIEISTIAYLAERERGTFVEIFPKEPVRALPHPFQEQKDEIGFSKAAYIFDLNDIDFWGRYGGSVVTSDNRLLADLSPEVWGTENHPVFSSFRLPKSRLLHGRTAICVTPEAPGNYYHWLIDLLPRVALVKKAAGFQSVDQILLNGSGAFYEQTSLQALGVPLDNVLFVDRHDRFQISRATIPSMDHSSMIVAPWKIRALRETRDAILGASLPTPKRLYISRARAAVRRVLNEAALTSVLQNNGFAVVELESMPWTEQVRLFYNAEIIFAPHGAALANIVFCRPNTLIVEIGTRSGFKEFYWRLASSAQLRYRFIKARPAVAAQADSQRAVENEDMIVDEEKLVDLLRDL